MKHFLSMEQLSLEKIDALLARAQQMQENWPGRLLEGKVVVNLFFEPSTRTRFSFEMAAKRLGADSLNFQPATSSLEKGESLLDTLRSLESMGVDAIVMRHGEEGLMEQLAGYLQVPLINAGEGALEHPSQCLLDLMTVRQEFGRLSGVKVALVGDLKHSRVVGSHLRALPRLGVEVLLAGPSEWMVTDLPQGVRQVAMDEALQADVVMMLRVQKERMQGLALLNLEDYRREYGLTVERAEQMSANSIIMHPAPINRGVEMDDAVVDHPRSRIFRQVTNGVAVRMAILEESILGGIPFGTSIASGKSVSQFV